MRHRQALIEWATLGLTCLILGLTVWTLCQTADPDAPGDARLRIQADPGSDRPVWSAAPAGTIDRTTWTPQSWEVPEGHHYDVLWSPAMCQYDRGALRVAIARNQGGDLACEIKTRRRVGYGRYEFVARPARGSGLISALFIYDHRTGDEVDIEFTGKDLSRVEFNSFNNRRRGEHSRVPLGFDAGEGFHHYEILWLPDRITWLVDGEVLFWSDVRIPESRGHLFLSVWSGSEKVRAWTGPKRFTGERAMVVKCVAYEPLEKLGDERNCEV